MNNRSRLATLRPNDTNQEDINILWELLIYFYYTTVSQFQFYTTQRNWTVIDLSRKTKPFLFTHLKWLFYSNYCITKFSDLNGYQLIVRAICTCHYSRVALDRVFFWRITKETEITNCLTYDYFFPPFFIVMTPD